MVHGCRQLVSWDVGLSPATSATPILCCQHFGWELMRDCRRQCGGRRGWRQIIMPLMTWATHVLQWELIDGSEIARWSKPEKHSLSSDRRLQLAYVKSESLVIAGQHTAVNTFPGLVHTARHTTEVVHTRSRRSRLRWGRWLGWSRNKVAVSEGAAGSPPF